MAASLTASGYSNQGASLNYGKVGDDYGEVTIEARRLDDEALTDVGFIKIDVEGHELEVLRGIDFGLLYPRKRT